MMKNNHSINFKHKTMKQLRSYIKIKFLLTGVSAIAAGVALVALAIVVFGYGAAYSNDSSSLLWKVTGNDMQYPLYIYGSIHALPQADFIIHDTAYHIFQHSSLAVFEVDLTQPDIGAEVQRGMLMTGTSIEQLLSDDDFSTLKSFVEDSIGLSMDAVKNVKPLMFSAFFIPKIIGSQPSSYDFYFSQKAQELSIPVAGLETVSEQFGYFDLVPLKEQAQMLMESVNDFDKEKDIYAKMIELYKKHDIEALYELTVDLAKNYESFTHNLLHKRNKDWIPKIINTCKEEACFVVVGAGHLGGEKGVINLLRKEGYSVKPVGLINN